MTSWTTPARRVPSWTTSRSERSRPRSPCRPITSRARRHGIPVRSIAAGDVIQVGVWRLDVLWPLAGFTPPPDANDAALVVLARAPGISALLTADAESNVLTRLRLRHVDVLKVSHHGSADSGLADVLRRLTPTSALISVGAGNSYGHPVPSTLATLAKASVRVERTDRSGASRRSVGRRGDARATERGDGVCPPPRGGGHTEGVRLGADRGGARGPRWRRSASS